MSMSVHETPRVSETKAESDYIAGMPPIRNCLALFSARAKEGRPCAVSKKPQISQIPLIFLWNL